VPTNQPISIALLCAYRDFVLFAVCCSIELTPACWVRLSTANQIIAVLLHALRKKAAKPVMTDSVDAHPTTRTGIMGNMEINRRTFLACMGAAAITRGQAPSPEASNMYGLVVKITAVPGKRDEMIGILRESAADMPGCLSYVIAKDSTNENVIWVTEVWESAATHDASLSLPSVTKSMPRVKPLIAAFDKIAVTTPIWGLGLPSTHPK
jgi:quinol monooxygenase YgiN